MVDIARVSSRLSAQRDKVDYARELIPHFKDCFLALGREVSWGKMADYLNEKGVTTNLGNRWYHGSVGDFLTLEVGVEIALKKAHEKIATYFQYVPDPEKEHAYYDRCDAIQRDANEIGPQLLRAWAE